MSREAMQLALEALEGNCTNPSADPEQAANEDAAITALRKALETEKQEPVAWRWKERINGDFDNWVVTFSEPPPYAVEQQPLYTAPPKTEQEQVECMCGICKLGKREWVGLTDAEVQMFIDARWSDGVNFTHFIRAIEAKLKGKNT
jgi:hypothetical protein